MKRNSLVAVLILFVFTIAIGATCVLINLNRASKSIQMADGSGPIGTCRPGANCGPDDQLRQMADGSGPIATWRPRTRHGYYAEMYVG